MGTATGFGPDWSGMASASPRTPEASRVRSARPNLAEAVAAIVAVAVQQARRSGELAALRQAIEDVLGGPETGHPTDDSASGDVPNGL